MEFKKLIFIFISIFSINFLKCIDFESDNSSESEICDRKITDDIFRRWRQSSPFPADTLDSNSLASFGIGSSGSESVKDGEGSLPENSSGSFGPASYRTVTDIPEVCDVKQRVEETEIENGRRNFDCFDANPDRCVVDPKRTEEAKAKFDSQYQEMMKECSVSHPEVKEYMADLNRKTDQNIKYNLEKAKIEARNIMAVLDGQEAPLRTYLKLAMATAMHRGIKKILPVCDAKRKREIKNFYRISHLCKMIEQIFPDIMDYCKDYNCIQTIYAENSPFFCITKLEEGIFVSSLMNGIIKIWQKKLDGTYACTQTFNRNLNGHSDCVYCVAKLEEGIFASGSEDKTIKIWQKKLDGTYSCIQTLDRNLNGHTDFVQSLVKLEKGIFASGAYGITKIWKKQRDGTYTCIQTLDENSNGHRVSIRCIAKLEKGIFASGSDDKTIKIWKKQRDGTYTCIQTLDENSNGHRVWIRCIAKLKKGIFASVGFEDGIIKIWQKQIDGTYICIQTLDRNTSGHTCGIACLIKLEERIFASVGLDGIIKIWQSQSEGTYACIQTMDRFTNGHSRCVLFIIKLDKGIFASVSGDNNIKIWHLNSVNQENLLGQRIKVEREQSWLSWAWENKYKIALCLAVAFAVYIKLFKD